MRCFIHLNDEAIAVCKKCGKAMCGNCSAYTNHSGICPECKREEIISERATLNNRLKENKKSTAIGVFAAVLFAAAAVILAVTVAVFMLGLLIVTAAFGIRILVLLKRRAPITERISYLTGEIDKLGTALHRSEAII